MIKLKVNVSMNGKKAGDVLTLDTDIDGNILDDFWSRRLIDSKIDNCVEVVTEKTSSKGEK